uniref:Uncharacterized protein n=2 Tax=Caenorhabditis japonica TaxID=281687 RepID=A0A8R1EK25_CAEJA
MKGDTELVKKLKRKLESGVSGDDEPPKSKSKDVVMMRRDREGNILPASSRKSDSHRHGEGSSRMRKEYEKSQDLDSMIREEKTGTAGDQLRLFEGSLIVSIFKKLENFLNISFKKPNFNLCKTRFKGYAKLLNIANITFKLQKN